MIYAGVLLQPNIHHNPFRNSNLLDLISPENLLEGEVYSHAYSVVGGLQWAVSPSGEWLKLEEGEDCLACTTTTFNNQVLADTNNINSDNKVCSGDQLTVARGGAVARYSTRTLPGEISIMVSEGLDIANIALALDIFFNNSQELKHIYTLQSTIKLSSQNLPIYSTK